MGYTSAKTKARFVLLTMLLGSTLGVFNSSYRGVFLAYGDPSSYEISDGGETWELAGGMLVLCQYSLEYTRSVLKSMEGDGADLATAWEYLAKAEEQYLVAQIQMFEYQDYHASVMHSRRVLELCEDAVELVSSGMDNRNVLGGAVSDFDLAWGAIERARTLLNNLEASLAKLNNRELTVIDSVLDDARTLLELAEAQLNDGDLDDADDSVNEAISLLGQARDLLQYVSRDKKIYKVLTVIEGYEEELRELEEKVVDALVVTEDSEELLAYVADVFQAARDEIEQLKSQLVDGDINLIIDRLETIFDGVLASLSSIGWLDESDASPILLKDTRGERDVPQDDDDETEPEEEPLVEEEPKDDDDDDVKDDDDDDDEDEDESVIDKILDKVEDVLEKIDDKYDEDEDEGDIDKILDKIEEWYDRKKSKKDKDK